MHARVMLGSRKGTVRVAFRVTLHACIVLMQQDCIAGPAHSNGDAHGRDPNQLMQRGEEQKQRSQKLSGILPAAYLSSFPLLQAPACSAASHWPYCAGMCRAQAGLRSDIVEIPDEMKHLP